MIPLEILDCLSSRFRFPEAPIIGQVATIENNRPTLRSMRMFDIDSEGRPILLTHVKSRKWSQLAANKALTLLLLSREQTVQIIIRGAAELLTLDEHADLLDSYWPRVRRDVRLTYAYLDPEGAPVDSRNLSLPEKAVANFGMIRLLTESWELLEINGDHYPDSRRVRFDRQADAWRMTSLNPI